jgi:alpha-mannosidase
MKLIERKLIYNEKVIIRRIERFRDELEGLRFPSRQPLKAEFIFQQEEPILYGKALESKEPEYEAPDGKIYRFKEINPSQEWGKLWGSGWFRFKGVIPAEWSGAEVGALIDIEAEGCIFKEGTPWQGLTNKIHWNRASGKRLAIIASQAAGGEEVFLLVEAAANGLFGAGQEYYRLQQCEICLIDRKAWQLYYDLETICSLIEALPEPAPRRRKLIYNANAAINLYQNGKNIDKSLETTAELLAKPAVSSTMQAYSVGHAHLDLAWLWRWQETRRKAGRTFSTALRMMEEYPEYIFGTSQPQLLEWVKEDYPHLFEEIRERIKEKR